jgi:hypothetical protein
MRLSGGLLELEHVVVMIVYEYLAYKASLGYVASSTCVLFALRVCSFMGGVYYHSDFKVRIKDNL